ncbi:hypothetical protein PoB_001907800 [Plakobranchus ocellatus]|uniref:Uncharacterized protein n=1 Tax=Plakobranchus ocellatus TaxID=259542 RepID=A0AAV3ZDP2_9GAST|nr:hypothetical protein PoB_001907800 [Plakobranchus ocellatus]
MGVSGFSNNRTRTSGVQANRIQAGACRHRLDLFIGCPLRCPQIDLRAYRGKARSFDFTPTASGRCRYVSCRHKEGTSSPSIPHPLLEQLVSCVTTDQLV